MKLILIIYQYHCMEKHIINFIILHPILQLFQLKHNHLLLNLILINYFIENVVLYILIAYLCRLDKILYYLTLLILLCLIDKHLILLQLTMLHKRLLNHGFPLKFYICFYKNLRYFHLLYC
jgi:hypothetical protein